MKVGDLVRIKSTDAIRELAMLSGSPIAGHIGVMIEEFQTQRASGRATAQDRWRVFVGDKVYWLYLDELEVVNESR